MHSPLFKFQNFLPLSTFILFFSSFCTLSVCSQFCFEVLCCSVRTEIYFARLLLTLLPLWSCSNAHLWHPFFDFTFIFATLYFIYKYLVIVIFYGMPSAWSFLPGSWWNSMLLHRGWLWQNCLQELPLTMGSVGSGFCVCLQPYWSCKIPHRAAPLPGTPWRTVTKEWGMTPVAPPLCCLSAKLWICADIPMFHHPFVF